MSISITQIQYVLALHEHGSFSDAADHCFVTQSTLSTMIKKLESQIGFQLFDRKSKPITLTNEGIGLINQFRLTNKEYGDLLHSIDALKEEYSGTLKIGIIPTVAPFLLPLFLGQVVSKYPDVSFIISESTTQHIVTDVKSRELDIGILSLPILDKTLIQSHLYSEDFLVYDTRDHGNTQGKHYAIDEIDHSRLWLLEEGHCLTHQIEQICRLSTKRTLNGNLTYKSGSLLSLLELVNLNHGITLLPRLATTKPHLFKSQYFSTIAEPTPVRQIGVISHPNFYKKNLVSLIEEVIIESVQPHLVDITYVNVIDPQ